MLKAALKGSVWGIVCSGIYGVSMVAVYAILMYSSDLCWPLLYGIADSLSPALGFNWGAKRYDRVRESYRFSSRVAIMGAILMATFVAVFADTFMVLFAGTDEEMRRISRDKVLGLVKFFEKYENEYGLLENLDSWIFIEWSKCNHADYVAGLNFPSNMLWAAALEAAAKLYGHLLPGLRGYQLWRNKSVQKCVFQ
mgnify:CR=1 FL=1